jgi:antirestriction protein ArdC
MVKCIDIGILKAYNRTCKIKKTGVSKMSKSVAEIVTEKIMEELTKGNIPWIKPWTGSGSKAINYVSRKPYKGINQWLLTKSGEYLTYKQATDNGGYVRKGEKGNMIVFYKMLEVEDKDNKDEKKKIPFLRYSYVYHISQCENINSKIVNSENSENKTIADIEAVYTAYTKRHNITVNFDGNEAFYIPLFDSITIPKLENFVNENAYYATYGHELGHSTGHSKRLDRELKGLMMDKESYSKEELTAEMTASMLMNYFNIDTVDIIKNATAYIQSWLRALKNDSNMIISASSKAQKAFELITEDTEEEAEAED